MIGDRKLGIVAFAISKTESNFVPFCKARVAAA